jgi:hypothetical protein
MGTETRNTNTELCLVNEEQGVRYLVKAALAGPVVCSPVAVVRTERVAPSLVEFEDKEAARKLREAEYPLQMEREVQRFKSD